ncbi:MAG: ATP-binding protein [Phormidesmis sp.]
MSVSDDSLFQLHDYIQDKDRLCAVRNYCALSELSEGALDELTRLAASLFQVPMSMVTLVDNKCQRFVSRFGSEVTEAPLNKGFCPLTVAGGKLLAIPNTKADERHANNPAVKEHGVQFYVGVPLRIPHSHIVGAVCVADTVPHEPSEAQLRSLETIAHQVVGQLELRRSTRRVEQATNALTQVSYGVASAVGDSFFSTLVQHFTNALSIDYAYVALIDQDTPGQLETLVACHKGQIIDNFAYDIETAPCRQVLATKAFCHYEQGLQALYPEVAMLAPLWIESYAATPILGSSGQPIGVLVVMDTKPLKATELLKALLNIYSVRIATELERIRSEERKTELLLREYEARQQAELANKMKDDFLAVVSHELRSPLNPILGWTQLLRRRNVSADRAEKALETIERNVLRQVELIDDLLDVSRILTGKLSLKTAPVHLDKVIVAALLSVQAKVKQKSIQLDYQNSADRSLVMGDADRLVQVVENLLSNAVKFTPENGTVDINLSTKEAHIYLEIQDSGKGISPDFLPNVFDHFRQEDYSTIRRFGGLGLGLAIVYHLVEMHKGTVKASSPGEGKGATFVVKLPLLKEKSFR